MQMTPQQFDSLMEIIDQKIKQSHRASHEGYVEVARLEEDFRRELIKEQGRRG